MLTLGVTIGGAALSMGGKKTEGPTSPPINAKSKDEESFVKYVYLKLAPSNTEWCGSDTELIMIIGTMSRRLPTKFRASNRDTKGTTSQCVA